MADANHSRSSATQKATFSPPARTVPVVDRLIPFGWYQIGWSHDFPRGEAKPLRYFGADLVVFRTDSGEMKVLDAFCPHLGAHLGHGGRVVGDTITCPWHGWCWDGEGRNVAIPYSDRPMAKRLRSWHVREMDDWVLVWYHPHGLDPIFEVPPFWVDDECGYLPFADDGALIWPNVAICPQYASENLVDYAHFKFVHRSDDIGRVVDVDEDEWTFTTTLGLEMGAGRPATWMTPEGPLPGLLHTAIHGPQVSVVRFSIGDHPVHDVVVSMGVTPVEASPRLSDLRITCYVPDIDPMGLGRDPRELATNWYNQEHIQVDQDVTIWSNMRYVDKAPLVDDEAKAFRAVRSWAEQFYVE